MYTRKESERCAALTDHQLIEGKNEAKKNEWNSVDVGDKTMLRQGAEAPEQRQSAFCCCCVFGRVSFADKLKDLLLLVSCHEFLSAYLLILIAQLFIMFAEASGLAASSRSLLFSYFNANAV